MFSLEIHRHFHFNVLTLTYLELNDPVDSDATHFMDDEPIGAP